MKSREKLEEEQTVADSKAPGFVGKLQNTQTSHRTGRKSRDRDAGLRVGDDRTQASSLPVHGLDRKSAGC